MSARALVCAGRLALASTALVAVATSSILLNGNDITCNKDGLYADFDTECQEYVRCSSGVVRGRYACPAGRVFSDVVGACVPRRSHPCARRVCAPGDTLAYATPGTACRHYYRCENGTAVDHACPSGSWFDLARQACSRGAGTCYEPVCAGLPDGKYPDSSHECRRTLQCRGAELRAVVSCGGACVSTCPPPRSAAVPLPAGDADFCSDEACSSLCQQASDGAYADRSTGCREYFVCESHRVIRRGVCEPGLLFSGSGCEPAAGTYCPPPARSPCFNRQDGLYRDWRDCKSWYECRRERVTARGACEFGFVFDGVGCVPKKSYYCEGPDPAAECEGMPSGTYQDLDSNCTRYFHCEGTLRTSLACPVGQVFDGSRCTTASQYLCPRQDALEHGGRYCEKDGFYVQQGTECKHYYFCVSGVRTFLTCPPAQVFNGQVCVHRHQYTCPG